MLLLTRNQHFRSDCTKFVLQLHKSFRAATREYRSTTESVTHVHAVQRHRPIHIEFSRSLLPDCGTLCRWTWRRHRQYLFSGNIWRPISSVILSLNLLYCLCSDVVTSDTIKSIFLLFLLTIYVTAYLPSIDTSPPLRLYQIEFLVTDLAILELTTDVRLCHCVATFNDI